MRAVPRAYACTANRLASFPGRFSRNWWAGVIIIVWAGGGGKGKLRLVAKRIIDGFC